MADLRSCPFCGGRAELVEHKRPYGMGVDVSAPWEPRCAGDVRPCGATLGCWRSRAQAVAAWNSRADPYSAATFAESEAPV